jgi:hypothetical protein
VLVVLDMLLMGEKRREGGKEQLAVWEGVSYDRACLIHPIRHAWVTNCAKVIAASATTGTAEELGDGEQTLNERAGKSGKPTASPSQSSPSRARFLSLCLCCAGCGSMLVGV